MPNDRTAQRATARKLSLRMTFAPSLATSRRTAWSLVTTTTGRSAGVAVDLGPDHVVGAHPRRRVRHPHQPPPVGVAADDVGAVEDHGDLAAEAAGDVVDDVEAGVAAGRRAPRPARRAWRRCSRRRARARPARGAGTRSPSASPRPRRRAGRAAGAGRAGPRRDRRGGRRGSGPTGPARRARRRWPASIVHAGALGPLGEQLVALAFGELGPPDRLVPLGLHRPPTRSRAASARSSAWRRRVAGLGELVPTVFASADASVGLRRSCSTSFGRARRCGPGAGSARPGCGSPPARPPPAAARPDARRPRLPLAPRLPAAAAISSATRSSHPSSRRSHSMPIGSTSSGSAPAATGGCGTRRRPRSPGAACRAARRDAGLLEERLQRRRVGERGAQPLAGVGDGDGELDRRAQVPVLDLEAHGVARYGATSSSSSGPGSPQRTNHSQP